MNFKDILFMLLIPVLMACDRSPEIPYVAWDTDGDGAITREEFRSQIDEVDLYSGWDKDGDGQLERPEWQTSFDEYYYDWESDQLPTFVDWDLDEDAVVSEEEFEQGTFNFWDANNDGRINREEYEERAHYLIKE